MANIIQTLELEQMQGKEFPDFRPGDTIAVQVKVKEGNRERLQTFEGLVIARRNRGLNSSFTVRKISGGIGVERVFPLYSDQIASITLKRRGDVRRAKLYYQRERTGKSARIKEKLVRKTKESVAEKSKAKKKADTKAKAAETAKAAPKAPATETKAQAKTEATKSQETTTQATESDNQDKES